MTGEELKNKITREGISITSLAKMMGTSQQNLSNKLATDSVKTGLLEEICNVLNMKINDFYVGTIYAVQIPQLLEGDDKSDFIKRLMDKLDQREEEISRIRKEYEEKLEMKDKKIDELYSQNIRLNRQVYNIPPFEKAEGM